MTDAMMLDRVSRSYRGGAGVREVSLAVRPGEVHALVGLNGAGKSTLMKLLLGMLRPDSGAAMIGGVDVRRADARTWSKLGQLIETPLAYGELTVRANLDIAARLRGVPSIERPAMIAEAVTAFRLTEYLNRRARSLSLGNRQRLGIAAALQHEPAYVVLDEPTNALDPAGTILLREAVIRRASQGAAVLISSHHLDEVARIADTITVMNAGRIIGGLDPHDDDLERAFFQSVLRDDEARSEAGGPSA
ncbi:ABC transporter ATP-binding protein [Agromyces lapidis]|uniref:ABC transporter ATP-binding protein n=1 Tax=Agromyces lapidis TaxID=279574 RepID=A0ABV5SWH5_9MICO|nr:ABC transporter ATP-binding protein [Agromyces lapidis]